MILLVGANGFLGRHTCELLESKGVPAVAVSRNPDRAFFERCSPSIRIVGATEFASSAGRDLIAEAQAIVYFTWCSVPSTFATEPWREVSENVEVAFKFFLRVAAASQHPKIVFLSSGGTVYGSGGVQPKSETTANKPISGYGLGKLMAEDALRFVGRTRGVPFAILRASNPVGRWQSSVKQGIVGAALRAAHNNLPLKVFGGGVQVRDFVGADDVAEAIYAACIDTAHQDATWNVGSGKGISVADIVHLASQVIGRPIRTEPAPARDVDVPHVVLDCRRIATDLGWTAKVPIEQSILELWKAICAPV